MASIRMRSAIRRPKVTAAVGLLGLVAAGSAVGVVSTAAAADEWASNNVYCYRSTTTNPSREFIRNVHYISATNTIDYMLEHQEWSNGGYARSGGTSRTKDVSGLGSAGVLSAFVEGGDPDWICNQWFGGLADGDTWDGVLTTDV